MTDIRLIVDRTQRREILDYIPDLGNIHARRVVCAVAPRIQPKSLGLDLLRSLGKRPVGAAGRLNDTLDLARLWLEGEGVLDVFVPHAELLSSALVDALIETVTPDGDDRRLWLVDTGGAPSTRIKKIASSTWNVRTIKSFLWAKPMVTGDRSLPSFDLGQPPPCDPVALPDVAAHFYSPDAQESFRRETATINGVVDDMRVPLHVSDEPRVADAIAGRAELLLRTARDPAHRAVRARLLQSALLRRGWHLQVRTADVTDARAAVDTLAERLRWYTDPQDAALVVARFVTGLSALDLQYLELANVEDGARSIRFAGLRASVPPKLRGILATQVLRRSGELSPQHSAALFADYRLRGMITPLSHHRITDALAAASAEIGQDIDSACWPAKHHHVITNVRPMAAA